MQSIVSINNKKERNNYIKFDKDDNLFNLVNDNGIIINFQKNMKDN